MPLPHVKTLSELVGLIDEIGMLPFFPCPIPGFSVAEITDSRVWWTDDPEYDPWQWRIRIAYGKVFGGKAGFVSLNCYSDFANLRRDGYDFDALYEDGKAPHSSMCIMKLFENRNSIPSYEIKALSGIQKGFQSAVARLQIQTYLTISGFTRRRNKRSEEYGWPIAELSPPELVFGEDIVRGAYGRSPEESLMRLEERLRPYAGCGASSLLSP
jgi:hypothetical protein